MLKDAIKHTTNTFHRADRTEGEKISQILKSWKEIENYSIEKYSRSANQSSNLHVKSLFRRLSSVGERHIKILEIIQETLTETGEIDHSANISTYVTIPEETDSLRYLTDVEITYHIMKSHLKFEKGLKKIYNDMKEKIKNKTAIALFHALAEDEKNHHEELLTMIKMFENTFSNILKT